MSKFIFENGEIVAVAMDRELITGLQAPADKPYYMQPADLFGGQGDFEYHPAEFELRRVREMTYELIRAKATVQATIDDCKARQANLIALFDRPLSKLNKGELKKMIQIAQDILVQPVEVLG